MEINRSNGINNEKVIIAARYHSTEAELSAQLSAKTKACTPQSDAFCDRHTKYTSNYKGDKQG